MIVYNVKRSWFVMKNDAEAYRKAEKLPPPATATIRVETREDLASLLNALCGVEPMSVSTNTIQVEPEVIERNAIEVIAPDFVPAFLLKDKH